MVSSRGVGPGSLQVHMGAQGQEVNAQRALLPVEAHVGWHAVPAAAAVWRRSLQRRYPCEVQTWRPRSKRTWRRCCACLPPAAALRARVAARPASPRSCRSCVPRSTRISSCSSSLPRRRCSWLCRCGGAGGLRHGRRACCPALCCGWRCAGAAPRALLTPGRIAGRVSACACAALTGPPGLHRRRPHAASQGLPPAAASAPGHP